MCERVSEESSKDRTADKFSDLAIKLSGELHLREKGHLPFSPKAGDRYATRDLPEKAVKAIYILDKIVDKLAALGAVNENVDGLFLLTYTTKEAIAAFEKGEAYGEKTRKAYLPQVYRHLLVQIAKNMRDPMFAVQVFSNDTKKLAMLDDAWKSSSEKTETSSEQAKPVKHVTEGAHTRVVHPDERLAGKRAAFHVHRETQDGKGFEPVWCANVDDAVAEVTMKYAMLKQPVRIYAVVTCAEKKL
jgi:hypothetical protein